MSGAPDQKTLTLEAPAKLNLSLDILGRRPDGYHELRMVMQTISLSDTVTVTLGTGGEVTVETDCPELPGGPGNLAYRAAETFFAHTRTANPGTAILLKKRIPLQAGLAGGSADGAAVLRALRTLLRPELEDAELEHMAEAVGSDVPFCVRGGTALAEGRGQRLTRLSPLPPCRIAVCKPDFGLSTPELFARTDGRELRPRPDTDALRKALERGDTAGAGRCFCNVFEQVLTPEEREAVCAIESCMRRQGALGAAMTGSGPTVFGVFAGEDGAHRALEELRPRYAQSFLTSPV
ncbi:MAG: 4-(cytidine 5'-diphospho)-2-C-methyl-D-erythritol kinase [Oscillibacter sp.]|jgi:4-diphosphocytidyl-2-C-methyl-D-erythritol kinase|nr:4-(cytidine 5'-diphospho)-2-C-methyl-D-erythritol kinase [Oscillibacter sp.]